MIPEVAFNAAEAIGKTAWPRSSQLHILQLATGHLSGTSPTDEVILDLLEKGPSEIARSHKAGSYIPNFIESFHDLSKVIDNPCYLNCFLRLTTADLRTKL